MRFERTLGRSCSHTEDALMSYQFVGLGKGVPGIPNEIDNRSDLSKEQQAILEAALKAGTFEEVKPKPAAKPGSKEGDE